MNEHLQVSAIEVTHSGKARISHGEFDILPALTGQSNLGAGTTLVSSGVTDGEKLLNFQSIVR